MGGADVARFERRRLRITRSPFAFIVLDQADTTSFAHAPPVLLVIIKLRAPARAAMTNPAAKVGAIHPLTILPRLSRDSLSNGRWRHRAQAERELAGASTR